MELETTPFELALCIEEAFDLFALQASAKKLELTYHIANEVPAWIIGDVTRLRQIIVNLVNNAVKFTPSGSIAVVVKSLGKQMPSGEHTIEFAIQDSGIGIPEDRLDRLFKAFSQVDSSTTRKYGGTGLGLAISQRLSQLMGGDVRVESKLGEGSSFIFTIETRAAEIPFEDTPSPLPIVAAKGTVLCIEDHPVTRAYLEDNLTEWGLACKFASNADEAVKLASEMDVHPSLLLIDGDGTEDAKILAEAAKIKVPRILMIPFGQSAPLAPDWLPFTILYKPLKVATVKQAVMQIFRKQGDDLKPAEERRSDLPLAQEFPLDILLVEDNAVNQKVALHFLQRIGYRADAVGNGLQAVNTLESRRYDHVFMDLQMPIMDGIEASRQIRRRLPADRQPKIVALTANAMQGDRELCISAGMDDYISKPVKIHEIDAAIRRQFGSEGKASNLLNSDKPDSSQV
jgi:CheY-like chemotaxis protein